MPLGDKKRHLDEQVAAAVRRAVEELQQEVRSRLQEATDSLQRSIGDITPRVPESFGLEDQLRSLTDEAAAAARAETLAGLQHSVGNAGRRESLVELRDAIAAIDRSGSQAEVLQAILDQSGPYASRAAIFLVRGGRVLGWGGRGFGSAETIRGLSFDADQAPWSDLTADGEVGSGLRELSAHESAGIASALESELPDQAVAVALVLRDRVAAVVYADQVGDDRLEGAALQILTYTAATALEAQPLRSRRSTGTLVSGGIAAATAAIVVEDHLPAFEPEPEPEAEPELPPEQEVPAAPAALPPFVATPEPEPAALPVFTTSAPPAFTERRAEPLVAAETEAWPLPMIDEDEPPALELEAEHSPELPAELPVELPPEFSLELPVAPSFDDVEIPAEATPSWADPGTGFDLEPVALGAAPTMRYELQELEIGGSIEPPESTPPAAPVFPPDVPSLAGYSDFSLPEDGSLEILEELPALPRPSLRWEEPEEEPPVPPVIAEPELAPEPITPPPVIAGAETVMVPTFSAAPALEPTLEPIPAAEPPAPQAGGQVQAPPDLDGPGWAFSTTSVPIAKGDEPSHEEARRLARLLVSEIQLYNQDEVEEGRRNRDLYERLKDDIDRSRQLYEERVDPAIRESTDYFYQELVRQLAAGDARALGI